MQDASALYRLLGDDARLRLLRLLALERLNVTELTGILGIAQSGVSRHLGLLKDGGLVGEEREAGFTYYRIAPQISDASNGHAPLWMLLQDQFGRPRSNRSQTGVRPVRPGSDGRTPIELGVLDAHLANTHTLM